MRDPSDPATPPPHWENKSDTKRSPRAPGTRGGDCPGTGHPGPRGHMMGQLGHPHSARGGDQADAGTATHRCRSTARCLRHGSSLPPPPPPGLLPPLPLFVIPLSSRLCSALLQLLAAIIQGTAAPADCSAPLLAAADRGFNDSPGRGRADPHLRGCRRGSPAPSSAKPSQLMRPGQG